MVRAAVTGAMDYSRADPTDNKWRIKHRLLLGEIQRREDQHMLEHMHRHWCAYLAHGSLTEESFLNVKHSAGDTLKSLQNLIFPWSVDEKAKHEPEIEKQDENSKMDDESRKLVERFKVWRTNSAEGTT